MTERVSTMTPQERKRWRRWRRWSKRLAIGSLLVGLAAGASAFDAAAPAVGLKGILPEEAPAELAAEAFEPLGPNWAEWSQGTVAAIQAFYKADGDVAAQQQQLAKLKSKLGVIDRAIKDAQYAPIHEALMSLRGPLGRRIAVAEAVLDTLGADPQTARREHLASKAAAVSAALADLEKDVKSVPGGSAWLPFIKADDLKSALAKSADDEAAAAALNTTKAKLARRETLTDAAQKQFLSRQSFLNLEDAVDAQLTAISAPPAADNTPALREALQQLVAAIDEFEATSSALAAADARAKWKTVKQLAPDGGDRLEAALSANYFNYNVRMVASEPFLSRLLADARVEQGQVSDYILGAAVGGWQTTSTNVGVDLKPAPDRVRFDLVLNGTVQSNTAGATSEATIYTAGYHTFVARKEVTFDGQNFRTAPATIAVNANNTTTGATTRYSGTLFGGMANRIAMREAAARRPQSQAIAASRVQDRVLPPFNSEADKSFAEAGQELDQQLFSGLRATGLYPDAQRYQSTDSAVRLSTRLMSDGELGGSVAESRLLPEANGAAMVVHESAVNNSIDRIGLNGKTMTEEELRHHLEGFLTKALAREFKFKEPEAKPTPTEGEDEEDKVPAKMVFAKDDPLRVQFKNGLMLLIIRAGMEREGKEPIPLQEITVGVKLLVEGDQIKALRDSVSIAAIEGDLSPIQRKVVNSKISAALPDRAVSAKFDLEGPKHTVQARVSRLNVIEGWIAVGVQ